jgi:hypothetical protein
VVSGGVCEEVRFFSGILESNSTREILYSTDKLSAGIYFIYMEGENIRKVKKMTIIK